MPAPRHVQRVWTGWAGIEIIVADSARSFGRHMHEEFGIGLIERGAQKSASGRGPVEADAGDLITVNPGEVHDGRPLDERGRRWRMLYLAPQLLHGASDDVAPGNRFEFTAPVLRDAGLTAGFQALFDAVACAGAQDLQAETALVQCVARLMRPTRQVPQPASDAVHRARQRLDDDPAAAPTLASLAAEAGLGRLQFLRAFSRVTGLPPHAYLVQRRIQRARQLIRRGVTLADAAAASGFADQSHMTRCFTRSLGLTPGAFRPT